MKAVHKGISNPIDLQGHSFLREQNNALVIPRTSITSIKSEPSST